MPLRRLLLKLRAYGVSGSLLKWLESFLVGRTQRVSVNGTLSDQRAVLSGVPQGSVLGPVLFLIFINDIVDELESDMLLFADDSKLFKHILSREDCLVLQRDLTRLEDWSRTWLLRFHPGKCHVLSLGKMDQIPCHAFEYQLCDHKLEHVFEERDLGVIIDCELTFTPHIDAMVGKANSLLGLIRRNFSFTDQESLVRLFTSFVRPHIEYAHAAWSPWRVSHIRKLEAVQMRALNLIPQLRGLDYAEQLSRTKLTTLAFRRMRGDMIDCWKHLNTYHSDVLSSSFKRNPRHPSKLLQTHAKPPTAKGYYHRIQELWNQLPPDVREAANINTFKNRLDNHWAGVPLKYNFLANTPTRINENLRNAEALGAVF